MSEVDMAQRVREELGSPSVDDLSDATIERLVDEEKSLFGAASRGAEILARRYAFRADVAIGDYRESFSNVSQRWIELAKELKVKAAAYASARAIVGSASPTADAKPDFWRGMWDNRG